jgi:hypothetical protein
METADRAGLERQRRCCVRPAFASEWLCRKANGQPGPTLTPRELLNRLAALIPLLLAQRAQHLRARTSLRRGSRSTVNLR